MARAQFVAACPPLSRARMPTPSKSLAQASCPPGSPAAKPARALRRLGTRKDSQTTTGKERLVNDSEWTGRGRRLGTRRRLGEGSARRRCRIVDSARPAPRSRICSRSRATTGARQRRPAAPENSPHQHGRTAEEGRRRAGDGGLRAPSAGRSTRRCAHSRGLTHTHKHGATVEGPGPHAQPT